MKLIVASDPIGGMGYRNTLPWTKIKGDLPRFKALTDNQKIIMGRKTWDSLPLKPLPGRVSYVVSSVKQDDVTTISIADLKLPMFDDAWLIGGATLIKHCWDYIDEIHLSRIFNLYVCDTYLDLATIHDKFDLESLAKLSDHTYEVWKRK